MITADGDYRDQAGVGYLGLPAVESVTAQPNKFRTDSSVSVPNAQLSLGCFHAVFVN
jgi:hypothetical protein